MVIDKLTYALPICRLHNSDRDWYHFIPSDTEQQWWVVSRDAFSVVGRSMTYYLRTAAFDSEAAARAEVAKIDNYEGVNFFIAQGKMECMR